MTTKQLIHDLEFWVKMRKRADLETALLEEAILRIKRLDAIESVTKEFTVS